ncbi:hypothetical protein [Nocardia sp. CA-135398]|uniref:hypothetical protein n=1 Tax=Nocardia sp. CA-135398 TaxID=3239977 RepID=UPI003D96715B
MPRRPERLTENLIHSPRSSDAARATLDRIRRLVHTCDPELAVTPASLWSVH